MEDRPRIQVILSSIREGRVGERVATWFMRMAEARPDLAFELVDLKQWPLPLYALSEPTVLAEKTFQDPLARAWVESVGRADGFVIVTPEYNFGYPPSLKNALDYAYAGWNRKPVAFVSYGGSGGGVRSVQQLRQVVVELQMAPLRAEVNIPFAGRAFDERGEPTDPLHVKRASALLEQLHWWAVVLQEGRINRPSPARDR
ncbi:MAG TPA: NAD(P)H-dependent oxidoreductase [Candidatus Limnocylindria bacterium]|nr:NAD(P)H-dependent oxidoreductase [Candidatus Limnocylindria bacterium]